MVLSLGGHGACSYLLAWHQQRPWGPPLWDAERLGTRPWPQPGAAKARLPVEMNPKRNTERAEAFGLLAEATEVPGGERTVSGVVLLGQTEPHHVPAPCSAARGGPRAFHSP